MRVQQAFARDGFARIDALLDPGEVARYGEIYDMFLRGDIECGDKRADLGGGSARTVTTVENITQIMWPSALYPPLNRMPLHDRALAVARRLIGEGRGTRLRHAD